MTIIVFLIDTSASMNQRAYLGGRPTLLDVAKGAVETFVKVRQRSPESRGDRYMLLTFEEPPANIKAGWKENLATFINELKNLQCLGMTTMGAALKHAFDVLNINRMQTGIDTYGQGRCPFYLEPSVIVVITDGGKLSSNAGVQDDFNLPMNCPIPGSELTREPFRWDQRLFSLVLRLSGTPAVERDTGLVPSDSSPIDAMCEVTGGRSYCITSHRMLMQCIDSLVQKVQSGVVINFEKVGADPPPIETPTKDGMEISTGEDGAQDEHKNDSYESELDKNGTRWNGGNHYSSNAPAAWHSCRRLIYVPRTVAQKGFAVGFWPIPESFRPDPNAPTLPPRTAHPAVKFTCTSQEPMVIDNLPFDKYELEPSPLTQFILARKQPTICWQVFVANSCKGSEMGQPFGYLKASTNLTCVNLFVMPYNYPVLLPLLDELFKIHRCKPPPEWKMAFQQYIDRMPSYYIAPLKRALSKMGAPAGLVQALAPEAAENSLGYSAHNYLKRLKNQAKMEFERLCGEAGGGGAAKGGGAAAVRVAPRRPGGEAAPEGFAVGLARAGGAPGRRAAAARAFRNAFDARRRDLLEQALRMRAGLLALARRAQDEEARHAVPVAQMGNYQEYLKRQAPRLRDLEAPPVRQHMFGNPFKIDKRMMVDEADLDAPTAGASGSAGAAAGAGAAGGRAGGGRRPPPGPASPGPPPAKRKPGPLPAHVTARRPPPPLAAPAAPAAPVAPRPPLAAPTLAAPVAPPQVPLSEETAAATSVPEARPAAVAAPGRGGGAGHCPRPQPPAPHRPHRPRRPRSQRSTAPTQTAAQRR